jgi:large subunit ribosomal protein L19
MNMNQSQVLLKIQTKQTKYSLPYYTIGDIVFLEVRVQEGVKQRIQGFQGVLIAKKTNGVNSTLLVRRTFQGVGVERVFLIHSPSIRKVRILRSIKVRRAKLYYLRALKGKAARLRELTVRDSSIEAYWKIRRPK